MVKPLAVVAVGGNALIQDEQCNSIPDQYVAVMESVQHIVDMVEAYETLVGSEVSLRRSLECAESRCLNAQRVR